MTELLQARESPEQLPRMYDRILRDVPFFPREQGACAPATIHSVLGYFMPELQFSYEEVDALCGYEPDRGAWRTQAPLSLAARGFEVLRIDDDDYNLFLNDPEEYMRRLFGHDQEFYEHQVNNSDLQLEVARLKEYIGRGLPYENRRPDRNDIKTLLSNHWLPRLLIDSTTLLQLEGKPPRAHYVLAVGFDKDNAIIHYPDGLVGQFPHTVVPWRLLEEAWDAHPSGVRCLDAYRRSPLPYGVDLNGSEPTTGQPTSITVVHGRYGVQPSGPRFV